MTTDTTFNPDISSVKESEAYRQREAEKKKLAEEKLTKMQRFVNFFRNGRTRLAIGVIFMLTGLYLAIAFISFLLGAGDVDQNRVMYYTAMENAHEPSRIHNAVGALGALVSEFFVRDGFGVVELDSWTQVF